MSPIILTSFELDGALWTVCVDRQPSVASGELSLRFVRDWILGGTRWIVVPFDDHMDELLATGPQREIDDRLRRMLAAALFVQQPRVPATSAASTSRAPVDR